MKLKSDFTLTNCDKEPIHIPGAIQPFGLLIALDDKFKIRHLSQNVQELLGRSVFSLLGQPIGVLVKLQDSLHTESVFKTPGPEFTQRTLLELKKSDGSFEAFDAFIHTQDGCLIIELEKPGKTYPADGLSFLRDIERSISEIQKATSIGNLCDIAVREVLRITGYDRVMVYRFDPDWNGEVIAEARSIQAREPYLGHHFPASDIPVQARAVFLANWVRMIPDVDYTPSKIEPTLDPETKAPLNLGRAFLRSVSPIHIQYLKNMKVGATLTISLVHKKKLWGLIACHNITSKFLPADLRFAGKVIGKLVSSQLGIKEEKDESEYQTQLNAVQSGLIEAMEREEDLVMGLMNYSPTILDLAGASGAAAALHLNGEWTLLGKTPTHAQMDRLADWLAPQLGARSEGIFHTDCLSRLFPEAQEYHEVASGLLAIGIPKADRSFIFWFRPEILQTVTWAGNPQKNIETLPDGSVKIEPRSSFESWKEVVTRKSFPWKKIEIEAAVELKNTIIGLDLNREYRKERRARAAAERLNREKEDLLNAVSHDLKTPLTAINLALQVFERQNRRNNVAASEDVQKTHGRIQASTKRMERLIHDLLDVAKIEGGTFSLDLKPRNINEVVNDAIELMRPFAQVKEIQVNFFPLAEKCEISLDEGRIDQILSNLLTNSFKFTPSEGVVTIAIVSANETDHIAISVQDTGAGILPESIPHVFDRFWQAQETNKLGSGLGLAICKGIVEAHHGNIWIESELGKGTKVTFSLPTKLPSEKIFE